MMCFESSGAQNQAYATRVLIESVVVIEAFAAFTALKQFEQDLVEIPLAAEESPRIRESKSAK